MRLPEVYSHKKKCVIVHMSTHECLSFSLPAFQMLLAADICVCMLGVVNSTPLLIGV